MRAKYYPKVDLEYTSSPFGVQECNYPNLYATPIKSTESVIVNSIEIDLLDCLKNKYGNNILDDRDRLYTIVSGSCPTTVADSKDEYYRVIFKSFYKRYSSFQNAVDLEVYFGRHDIPFIRRFISPIKEYIDDYTTKMINMIESCSTGKVLMISHYKLYAAFRTTIPEHVIKYGRVIKNV